MIKQKQSVSKPKARRMTLANLRTEPETFQFRAFETEEHHVQDLAASIKAGNEMDPLTVWKRGDDDYVVLNGHHRHAAYARCDYRKPIAVNVFECSEAEAKLIALEESTKTKLPMTNVEKLDAAWRLVCTDHDYSRAQLVKSTGAGDGTIAKMRRHRKTLEVEDLEIPASWWLAQRRVKGLEKQEWDNDMQEQMIQTRAKALDDAIGQALGRAGKIQWEAVAIVLERRLNKQTLGYVIDELRDEDEEDENNSPF
ncbi:hypothetical protein MED193_21029 [Roseobacter sp. MED193]|uniref:ParB/RepB/Spo0J family partition protein n=1 Tax=Roseobacter sp. MED193 TaxID=314262 RepID=UPI000068B996|nr:ParB N-terminal domain-containing protein [Roseobacter sp. MED193]EAQ47717.1 hypothetical protein MED193_21029 [Roseobacter sp. MED193]